MKILELNEVMSLKIKLDYGFYIESSSFGVLDRSMNNT